MFRWICVTGVSTPYRRHFWISLQKALRRRGGGLEIWLLGRREHGRHWNTAYVDEELTGRQIPGETVVVSGLSLHVNWGVFERLQEASPDFVLASGAWWLPGVLAASALRGARSWRSYFWSESNASSMSRPEGLAGLARRTAYQRFDGFVVPGTKAAAFVAECGGRPEAPMVFMPNLVDETLYRDEVYSLRRDRNRLRQMWLGADWKCSVTLLACARLEREKGLDVAIEALIGAGENAGLVVVGEGSCRSSLEEQIRVLNLSGRVRLLGNLPQKQVLQILALADAFILPSRRDPSPLAVVEAAWAGLPLLLSRNVGCEPEYLAEGGSGFSFESNSVSGTSAAIKRLLEMSAASRLEMGEAARARCEQWADSGEAVERLIAGVDQT